MAIRVAIRKWSNGEAGQRQRAEDKATCMTELYNGRGVLWHERDKLVGERTLACNICHRLFSNKAALGSH